MTDTTITVRVSKDLRDRLEALGASARRSKSFLANEAISRYVESESEMIEGMRAASAELRGGKGIPHEKVMKEYQAIIDKAAKKQRA